MEQSPYSSIHFLLLKFFIVSVPNIRRMALFASNVSHISMMEIIRLSQECEQLLEDINVVNEKIEEILSAYQNHSSYISEGIEFSEYIYDYVYIVLG